MGFAIFDGFLRGLVGFYFGILGKGKFLDGFYYFYVNGLNGLNIHFY